MNLAEQVILDIGGGAGGDYWNTEFPGATRICVENNYLRLSAARSVYPHIQAVYADARRMDFSNDYADMIEVVLPSGELLVPGIQTDHPALLRPYVERYERECPQGWYREFARVLKPGGKMRIRGDIGVYPPSVMETSGSFFRLEL